VRWADDLAMPLAVYLPPADRISWKQPQTAASLFSAIAAERLSAGWTLGLVKKHATARGIRQVE